MREAMTSAKEDLEMKQRSQVILNRSLSSYESVGFWLDYCIVDVRTLVLYSESASSST